ncbi:hypothetical protein AXG93_4316s1160 [Marchantia polymorpha subsp. ruderalis]|uniref:Condensin complex subunit 1 C-terminal domain-containing protein n=1 Tax=Marchantia polymorpha subsp. ruderalis TaxID=1480154 RepID=A0A176VTW2_MARPO|nr:hypothetical protein AXG93_4316s1160 [Marchantia polymorpha subsp. ruderalis]
MEQHLSSLLYTASTEYELAGGQVGSNGAHGASLSAETLSDLHDFFQSSGSRNSELSGLWDDLAEKKVSLGAIVEILSGTMQKGGIAGVRAVEVYLSLLMAPDCPVYSLFSQMAFDALARCLRNCCKPVSAAALNVTADIDTQGGDKGIKGHRKGKRQRGGGRSNVDNEEIDMSPSQLSAQSQPAETVSVQDIMSSLLKLQKALLVLHLRERQETLKLVLELLVSMLHLLSEMEDEENRRTENGGRAKKRAVISSPRGSIPDSIFQILESLLDSKHGQPLKNAVMILRELTPTILLNQPGGTGRSGIRSCALQFVTRTLLKTGGSSVQPAVAALPRYICCKAPEKTDGRLLAIDSAMTILHALDIKDLCQFADFIRKFSHSKPRHRLIAVDVALALLGGFPDALRCPPPLVDECSNPSGPSPYERGPRAHNFNGRRKPSRFNNQGASVQPRKDGAQESADEVENNGCQDGQSAMDGHQHDEASSSENQWWGVTCIEVLLHRSSDKIPSVRARSLANLAQAIELLSVDVSSRRHLQSLLGFNGIAPQGTRVLNANSTALHCSDTGDTPILGGYTPSPEPSSDLPGATPLTPGAGHRDLWSLLQRRCLDDKVAVRKSALVLMKKSTTLLGKAPEDDILHALGAACGDSMISIRKSALAAISEVLRKFPGDLRVAREWLRSALPLAFDNETTLQDECLNLFEELVVDRVSLISTLKLPRSKLLHKTGRGIHQSSQDTQELNDDDVEKLLPIGALGILKEMADGSSISSCVKRICFSLGKKKRLRPGVALALQNLISAHRSPDGAWFLLSEVSEFVPKAVGWEFLRTHWQLLDGRENGRAKGQGSETLEGTLPRGTSSKWAVNRVHLLQTISNVAVELPPDAAADLASELLERLQAFDMHSAEVGAHIKALAVLCKRKVVAVEQGDQLVEVWVKQLLEESGNILESCIKSPSSRGTAQEGAEDAFRTPVSQTREMQGDKQTENRWNKDRGQVKGQVVSATQLETVVFTVGALALVCPRVKDARVVTLVQTLITTAKRVIGRTRGGEAQRLLIREKVTPEVYVHLWVALGKLCLADDSLAKRCIPLFVQELGRTNSAAVRNNITIVMTDFCVRYTALVDGYLHDLTKSLKDSCELVRRQTFVLLSRLLQRDYVKWRGMLFHRFLLMLVDDSPKISQLAKFVFSSILKLKAPLLAYNSFVEALFVLNDCVSQASSSAMLQVPESERSVFSLRGNTTDVVEKRMQIYGTLLQQMNPEHLLATSAKLCSEVLAAAADGLLDLKDGPSQCVLQDALLILASKELRIINPRASAGTSELEDDDGGAAAAVAAVKGRVVTQLMKKNLVQNAVPIFIELKRLLESQNSPMLGLLMDSMRQMLKDYKSEIEEILVADKQLQKEILYDMQKHEAAKARAKVVAAIPVQPDVMQGATPGAVRTPVAISIHSATVEQMGKSAQDSRLQGEAISKMSEKENMGGNLHSRSGLQRSRNNTNPNQAYNIPPKSPVVSAMRKSPLDNLLSPRGDNRATSTPRVTWQHGTPTMGRTMMHCAVPSSGSHQAQTPHHPHTTQVRPPDPLSPLRASQEETCLAGAVADVAAAATVATVLQQVAQRNVTPLRGMSLPRLRPSVATATRRPKDAAAPPTSQLAAVSLDERTPAAAAGAQRFPGSPQCLAGEEESGLETVRRRQSFSSIDDPCGLP